MLKTSKNPLQQFINRVHENRNYIVVDGSINNEKYQLQCECNDIYFESMLQNRTVKSYERFQLNHYYISPELKNSHSVAKEGVIINIKKIIKCLSTNEIYVIYNRYCILKIILHIHVNQKCFLVAKLVIYQT